MTVDPTWTPSLGAWIDGLGTHFRVWAPDATSATLVVEGAGTGNERQLVPEVRSGYFGATFPDVPAGAEYRYRIDGGAALPDPASRRQPQGVHGPSSVVDPRGFRWSAHDWVGVRPEDLIVYELHVGSFSPEGTFAGAAARLDSLASLGITAIELMPVADFPGRWNWGYDGVSLFAPARCYGTPDDLRLLVDRAHSAGLAVVLDVVYNHLGPDGNYLSAFSRHYFTERHQTPWGAALNLDQEHSAEVRHFVIENALHWMHEYRFDGLRLDATHALIDESPRHLVAELTATVRRSVSDRRVWMCAEDHRNLAVMLKPASQGGWGLDAVWADDLHHQLRRHTAGDVEGYYEDFDGTAENIARTLRQGWFFTGQRSRRRDAPRGTDPAGIAPHHFVVCLQNHDQIGNRALGDRLHHVVDLAMWRALSALLLLAPEIPLLFMGQEWAASSPFLYFTDHHEELGRMVTAGRRMEFQHFNAFADPVRASAIPDPQAEETFRRSALHWPERDQPPHAQIHRLYGDLLALRKTLNPVGAGAVEAIAVDQQTVLVKREQAEGSVVLIAHLGQGGTVVLPEHVLSSQPGNQLRHVLSTEDQAYAADSREPVVQVTGAGMRVIFERPGALVIGE
jgi:maltooligosyltrehalose trehalohydrolase